MDVTTTPKPKEIVKVQIDHLLESHLDAVVAIEELSYELRWTKNDFKRLSRRRDCILLRAEVQGQVVGFVVYKLEAYKLVLWNIAVHPDWRDYKVGAQMVAKLIGKLSEKKRTRITLEVRETNLPAQLFFRKQGFRATKVSRAFYEDTGEDAYVMEYHYQA